MEKPQVQSEKPKKKKHIALKIIISLIAVVVLLLAGLWALLYFTGFEYRPVQEVLDAPVMSEAERFSFDAKRYTASVVVADSDIVWVLKDNGTLDDVQDTLETYRATLDKCAVNMQPDSISIAAEVKALGFVKVPLKADGVVELDEDEIVIRFTEAWLGSLLRIPTEKLCALFNVEPEELGISIDKDEHPWLEKLSAIRLEDGRAVLECDMGKILFDEALKDFDYCRQLSYFPDDSTVLDLAMKSYYTPDDYVPEGFDALMQRLQQEPAYLAELRSEVLAVAQPRSAENYVKAYGNYMQRFLPSLTPELTALQQQEHCDVPLERLELVKTLLTSVQQAYFEGGLTQTRATFLDNRTGEPINVADFASDWSLYDGWFKADTVYWVFMSQRTARLKLEGVPKLGDVPSKNPYRYDWDTGRRLDDSTQLPLGMALELTGGGHATAYMRVDDSMVLVDMEYNEERGMDEYEILQQDCNYIPTVRGRMR